MATHLWRNFSLLKSRMFKDFHIDPHIFFCRWWKPLYQPSTSLLIYLRISLINHFFSYEVNKCSVYFRCMTEPRHPFSSASKLHYAFFCSDFTVDNSDAVGWYSKTQLKVCTAQVPSPWSQWSCQLCSFTFVWRYSINYLCPSVRNALKVQVMPFKWMLSKDCWFFVKISLPLFYNLCHATNGI